MKLKQTLTFWLFLLCGFACCHSAGGAAISIVVVSPLCRVLQEEVNVSGCSQADLFCARGESESFQIIVQNPTTKDVAKIQLQAGTWRHIEGESKAVPVLHMFREHYVHIKRSSGRTNRQKGMYPDALIPFVNPYTGRQITTAKYLAAGQDVKAGNSQGYWVDISVDRDVPPGEFTNQITVSSAGEKIATIPITLTVWDFELPEVHKLKTYFGKMLNVSDYHGVRWDSPEYKEIVNRYLLLLREHGANVPFEKSPLIDDATGEVSFSAQYIKELKEYVDKYKPSVTRVILLHYPFTKDPAKRARYLSGWEAFIKRNRWIPEPVVYTDEPNSKEDYSNIIEYGKAINAYAPSIKYLVTEQVAPQEPGWPSLEGAVDIWVPTWHLANPIDIERRQRAGDEVWSYTALDHEGVPNWLLDYPLLDYRVPAWFSWSLDLKGILYWQTMEWAAKGLEIDPWVDCQTYSKGGKVWNGAGCLIYPGEAAGVDGPIASMRLKVFRDSIEDYDYFSILSEIVGRDKVDRIVKNVASSFRTYSNDINAYLEARISIAKNITENKR